MLRNCLLIIFVQFLFEPSFSFERKEKENLCVYVEKYPETVERIIVEPVHYKYYEWCLKVPPRCTKFRTVLKEKTVVETVERNRFVEKCCDGFVKISANCVPECPTGKICPNMKCTDLKHCYCQPGFTGLYCNTKCSANFWGKNCEQKCSCDETTSVCSQINGTCILKPPILPVQNFQNQTDRNSTPFSNMLSKIKGFRTFEFNGNPDNKTVKPVKILEEHQTNQILIDFYSEKNLTKNVSHILSNSSSKIPASASNLTIQAEDKFNHISLDENTQGSLSNNSISDINNDDNQSNKLSNIQIFDASDDNKMENGLELIKETYSWKLNQEKWPTYLSPEFLPSLIIVSSIFFIVSLLCLMSRCQVPSSKKTAPVPILEIDSTSSAGHCESKLDEFFCPVFQNTHSLQFMKDVQEMHYDHPKAQRVITSEPIYAEIR